MGTVYGYGRASTHKQSLTEEVQRHKVEEYATRALGEHAYAGFLYDAETSGKQPLFERPAGLRLWCLVQPGDHVVWAKLDRAFRSVVDGAGTLQMLHAKGVSVHSLDLGLDTGTPTGRFVATCMLAFSQLERECIGERTKDGMASKKRQGLPVNHIAPIGWRKIGLKKHSSFVPDPVEREHARQICTLRAEGRSIREIVDIFKRVGARPNGRPWTKHSVYRAIAAREAGFPKHFAEAEARETYVA